MTQETNPEGTTQSTPNSRESFTRGLANEGVGGSPNTGSESGNGEDSKVPEISGFPDPSNLTEESSQEGTQEELIEIDERYKDLDPREGGFRTLKSKYDKLYSSNEKLVQDYQKQQEIVHLFNNLTEDRDLLLSLINEVAPDLVPKQNIASEIKSKLDEEFPEFKESPPSREDADKDLGNAWLYYRRRDELYDELRKGRGSNKKFSELIEQRKKEKEAQTKKIEEEVLEAAKAFNYDEKGLASWRNWVNKLTVKDLMKMHQFAIKTMRIPQGTEVPGGPAKPSQRNEFLKSLRS